jgi:hypothetical protein
VASFGGCSVAPSLPAGHYRLSLPPSRVSSLARRWISSKTTELSLTLGCLLGYSSGTAVHRITRLKSADFRRGSMDPIHPITGRHWLSEPSFTRTALREASLRYQTPSQARLLRSTTILGLLWVVSSSQAAMGPQISGMARPRPGFSRLYSCVSVAWAWLLSVPIPWWACQSRRSEGAVRGYRVPFGALRHPLGSTYTPAASAYPTTPPRTT